MSGFLQSPIRDLEIQRGGIQHRSADAGTAQNRNGKPIARSGRKAMGFRLRVCEVAEAMRPFFRGTFFRRASRHSRRVF